MEKTVLLVEDNPDEILLARRAFGRAGLADVLRVADNGAQACRLLASPANVLPSLVLLDLQMPEQDGLSVLREMRALLPAAALPIVMLSSSDEPGDIAAAYAGGASSYVRKPVDFNAFVQLVGDLHRYWLVHNALPATRSRP
jgi:CheY-like chemotaxis protein